jgi:hypothetical protein
MSDDDDWESAGALRAKAAHCLSVAELMGDMGEQTRARLIRIATKYLERAAQLDARRKAVRET